MVSILAIDCSLRNIGWACRKATDINIVDGASIVSSGTVTGSLGKTEPIYKRIAELVYVFERVLPIFSPTYILIERSFVAGSGDVTRNLAETQGVVKNMLYTRYHNFIMLEPPPSTWRHIILGNGKVDKKKTEVFQKCKLLGLTPKTEHEAEAMLMSLSVCDSMFKVLGVSLCFNLFE